LKVFKSKLYFNPNPKINKAKNTKKEQKNGLGSLTGPTAQRTSPAGHSPRTPLLSLFLFFLSLPC
jgi:hypothetical protein